MTYDGSPEHLTWDGLIKDESKESNRRRRMLRLRLIARAGRFSPSSSATPAFHIP